MLVQLVLWNLADSRTTIAELRRYLRDESVDAFADVPGLRFKAWISDEVTDRWGAVYVWESPEAARQVLPSGARELIGKEPDIGEDSRSRRRSKVCSRSRSCRAAASRSSSGPVQHSAQNRHPRARNSSIRSPRGGGWGYLS